MTPATFTREEEQKAAMFALFGDPSRLRIVRFLLKEKKANVTDIAAAVEMSIACTSHHLQLLKDNQVLSATREGNNIYYQFTDHSFIHQLKHLII